jgi:hypothetical protein
MGVAFNNSVFEGNAFEGRVGKYGILLSDERTANPSHGHRFDLGDSLARLGAETTLTLSKDSHGNVVTGNLGKVADKSPKGANEYKRIEY